MRDGEIRGISCRERSLVEHSHPAAPDPRMGCTGIFTGRKEQRPPSGGTQLWSRNDGGRPTAVSLRSSPQELMGSEGIRDASHNGCTARYA